MARSFNGTSGKIAYAGAVSSLFSASLGSMAIWHKPTGTPASAANVFSLPGLPADSGAFLGLQRGSLSGSDQIYAYNFDGTADAVGFAYTNDAWVHCGWMHSGGTLSIFKDGAVAASTASGNTTSLTGTFNLGTSFADVNFLAGLLAEWACWDVALDTAEWAALGQGYSPLLIRPGSLTRYAPLGGRVSPETDLIAAQAGTLTGTSAGDHPRVFYGTGIGRRKVVATATPSGGGGPLIGGGELVKGGLIRGGRLVA